MKKIIIRKLGPQRVKHLKWNLKFANDKFEGQYLESKQSFQKPVLKIVMAAGLLISLLAWIMNPLNQKIYEGMMLAYMITLFLLTALFYFLSRRYQGQKKLEFMVTFIILYLVLGILESTKQNSMGLWGKLYYYNVGTMLEFVLVIMIFARIGWIQNVLLFFIIISLVLYRYTPFQENFDSKFYPFIIQVENFIFLSFIAYIMEKGERSHFFEVKSFQNSLTCFKELITDFIPISIVILHKDEMVFHNKEAEKLFESCEKDEIFEQLTKLKISNFNSPSRERIKEKTALESNFLLEQPSPTILGNDVTSLLKAYKNCQELFEKNGSVLISAQAFSNDKENRAARFYEVKFKDVFWEGSNSIMILIEESKIIEKINLLKEQADYKNKLLATVSHDLRTPLYGIMGMINACNEISPDPLIKKNLSVALRSSQLLHLMINDILDYSQISNGRLRLNKEDFSLWEVIKDVTKLIKFQAKKKGLEFVRENKVMEINPVCLIKNDPNRIKQVLLNLLNNALKFTDKGSIKVSIEQADESSADLLQEHVYIIKVIDTGLGIEKEEIPNLFRLFGKSNNAHSLQRNKSGIGLGLAISKSLLEMLNGDPGGNHIHVESEYGKGSCFTFVIKSIKENRNEEDFDTNDIESPKENKKTRVIPNLETKSAKQGWNKSRILLVDDDQINIIVGSSYLKSMKTVLFDTAFNGLQALQKIKESATHGSFFHIILMDCNMPVMDGFQAALEIKQLVSNNIIPDVCIIACTANVSFEDKEKCLKAGMKDLLTKPFSKKDLEEKIEQYFGLKENN